MSENDEFRRQVEELKQRLGATHAQQERLANDLSGWFSSIRTSLQQKQDEIDRLSAENQQLRVMLDEVIDLLNQRQELNSGQMIRGFFDEIAEFIEEGEAAPSQPRSRAIEMPPPSEPSIWRDEPDKAIAPAPASTPPADESAEGAGNEDEDGEEVPALKRILKRGQRGR